MEQTCSRCSSTIQNPDNEANYVRSTDFAVQEERETIKALKHTDRTRNIRDKIVNEYNMSSAEANTILARNDQNYLTQTDQDGNPKFSHDVPETEFVKEEVDSPTRPEDDPEVIKTVSETVTEEVVKTGLVCKDDCTKTDDQILW